MKHGFWQGELEHLAKELDVAPDMRESMRQSIANFSTRASSVVELPKVNSVLGQIHGVHLKDPPDTGRDQSGVIQEGDAPGGGAHPGERPGDHLINTSPVKYYVLLDIVVCYLCSI